MGEWTQQTEQAWVYRQTVQRRPYGYVLRQHEDGVPEAVWNALVVGAAAGTQERIREHVSLDEAKRAVEQHAVDAGAS
jgi:hypothetical protein